MTMTKGVTERFKEFWWGERGLTALLAFLFCSYFLAPLLNSVLGSILIGVFFTLLLVSGVANISTHLLPRLGAGLIAASAIILHWLQDIYPSPLLTGGKALFSLLYFLLLTGIVLHRSFRDGPVTADRVRGAIAAYILLAITWSYLYELIELVNPGAFTLPPSFRPGEDDPHFDLTYFSFITLTTLGYGDITPLHPTARMFVIMEALMGQLYPATLLARLVSLELAGKDENGRGRGTPPA